MADAIEKEILGVAGLGKRFGRVEALRGIDISLSRPGVYGFLGPNGAGKTTTFKIIAGLLRPTSGSVSICGIDVHENTREAMRNIGILFDAPAYYPYLSGRDNLEVFARWSGRKAGDGIGELLEKVGLAKAGTKKVGEYSWGMKRRLGIAAALLGDPPLIIMDEPTNGLDPAGIAEIRRLLPELAYRLGRVILFSSHRMDEVDQVCDRMMIIKGGEIIASGTTDELSRAEPVVEIVCSDTDRAARILSGTSGIEKMDRTGPDRLRILTPGMRAAAINSLLIEAGVEVRQVMESKESLEDIFFRLTGTGQDDQ